MTLTTEDGKPCEGIEQGPFEPIAVVGLGALMPDAHNIDAFWQNILDAKVSIKPLPEGRWPGPIHHFWKEGGPGEHSEGYTYSKIGALVKEAEFDWRRWRQPPGTLPQIDPCQLWAVTVSADAIEHAGYDGESNDLDRTRTGVVFANALGGENRNMSNIRVWANHTAELAKQHGMPAGQAEEFTASILEGTPRVDEDTMPGELANVVSGRVANLLDLQGPNHAMDAACASSMAAVLDACRLLKPVKSTSCSQEHPTGPWILQPSQNSLLSGRFHRRTPLRLMPVRTALSWARELACWCSSVSAMQFEMRTKFSA